MLFDGHRPHLNKRMLVVLVFPMTFVTVPIAIVVVVPICVIPIVVPSFLVSLGGSEVTIMVPIAISSKNSLFMH